MYHYGKEAYKSLNKFIDSLSPSQILIIDDENTDKLCYPVFKNKLKHDHRVVSISPGEKNKSIRSVQILWDKMLEMGLDKHSLVINLGGGIITDLGGFTASSFKRGMPFIHVPTSLLGMVDAAIGGKNGINFGGAKNQIGVIKPPEMILIDSDYLKTLPENEIKSGYAEMLKHGLIADESYWSNLIEDFNTLNDLNQNIKKSVQIKDQIISEDPLEKGLRKVLNFGHTLGHAIESYSYEQNAPFSHGHSIALGMILASYLSYLKTGLEFTFVNHIKIELSKHYPIPRWDTKDIKKINEYLKFDKKNIDGEVLFVLLEEPGKPVINQKVSTALIDEAFRFLMN